MNVNKLLIIIILIIIIFIIIFNHKYEHLTETNDKTTTLDALNNITNLINEDKITSKNLEIINNANINNLTSKELTIDKINVKDLNVSNSLINKNFTYFYDDNATIIIIEVSNPPVELKIDNVEVFGIISKNKKTAIIYSNYFIVEPKHVKWLGIKEIKLNSYNITLKPKNEFGPMGNIVKYTYQSDNLGYGNNVEPTSDYEYPERYLLIKMKLKYLNYIIYYITTETVGAMNFNIRKYYFKLDTVSFNVE